MNSLDVFRFICDTCGYRFFTGQPVEGHSLLFRELSPKYMHYIPTITSDIAINLAAGASYAGVLSAVFIDHYDLVSLWYKVLELSAIKEISILFITNKDVALDYNKILLKDIDLNSKADKFLKLQPNILVIEPGDLHE